MNLPGAENKKGGGLSTIDVYRRRARWWMGRRLRHPPRQPHPRRRFSIDTVSGRRLRHVLGEKIPWIPVSHPVHGRRVNHHTLPIPRRRWRGDGARTAGDGGALRRDALLEPHRNAALCRGTVSSVIAETFLDISFPRGRRGSNPCQASRRAKRFLPSRTRGTPEC